MKKTIKVTQEVVVTADSEASFKEAIADIKREGLFLAKGAGNWNYTTKDEIIVSEELKWK